MNELIVDTHAHIYSTDEETYPMIAKPYRPPEGTGDIDHLRRERETHGVDRVVLVQTGSAYKWDNRLIADLARENTEWTTAVCNLNPVDPYSAERFEALVKHDNIRALRLEPAPDGRFDHEGSRAIMARAQAIGAVICAHIHAAALPELAVLLKLYPDVPVVLDHCAYPDGADGPEGETVRAVVDLAKHSNLIAKLTFMVTRSATGEPFDDTLAIARRVIDVFGADRCIWGSDFPTELWLKDQADYARHLSLVSDGLDLSAEDRAAVLGETAMRIFFP